MSAVRLLGSLDPNAGWAGGALLDGNGGDPLAPVPQALRGAYASVDVAGATARLVRDPLGLGKLFWAPGGDWVLVSARPHHLVGAGCRFAAIRAVPPGAVIHLDLATGDEHVEPLDDPARHAGAVECVETLAERIRDTLHDYCAALAAAHPRAPVFVCLSGGLDSAGIAVLARAHFSDVTAVSFDLDRGDAPPSADRRGAERLAADLGLALLAVTVTEEELLEGLDMALLEGIDWRDFNVHAALVNVALGRGIAAHAAARGTTPAPDSPAPAAPLVLTGDLANEFICDYHAETYGGRTYYALPRLPPATLQRTLVRGVETSHRETGPFAAWGLRLIQPYAPAVDHYLALPETLLADPTRKERLCSLIFAGAIPDHVYTRPKTRAQIGDPAGRGVLAVCIDRGIDQAWLRRRFAELHRVVDPTLLERFIRGGRYRSGVPARDSRW